MAELVTGDRVKMVWEGQELIGKLFGYRPHGEALVIVRNDDEPGVESLSVYTVDPDLLERVNG